MTRFNMFTDEKLDAMESAFCNERLTYLVDEIRRERKYRERSIDNFTKFAKEQFGVELVAKKSNDPDTFEKIFE